MKTKSEVLLKKFKYPNFKGYTKDQKKYFKAIINSINKRLVLMPNFVISQGIDVDYYGIGIMDKLSESYEYCGFKVSMRNFCVEDHIENKKVLVQGLFLVWFEE